eukprot:272397_1
MVSNRQTISIATINLFKEKHIEQLIDYDRNQLLQIIVTTFHNNKLSNPLQNNNKHLQQVEKIYKELDGKYWKAMGKYLQRQHKRNIKKQNKINELLEADEEPWTYIEEQRDRKIRKYENIMNNIDNLDVNEWVQWLSVIATPENIEYKKNIINDNEIKCENNNIGELATKGVKEPTIIYRYTNAEKIIKRKYCWRTIEKMAQINKLNFTHDYSS